MSALGALLEEPGLVTTARRQRSKMPGSAGADIVADPTGVQAPRSAGRCIPSGVASPAAQPASTCFGGPAGANKHGVHAGRRRGSARPNGHQDLGANLWPCNSTRLSFQACCECVKVYVLKDRSVADSIPKFSTIARGRCAPASTSLGRGRIRSAISQGQAGRAGTKTRHSRRVSAEGGTRPSGTSPPARHAANPGVVGHVPSRCG